MSSENIDVEDIGASITLFIKDGDMFMDMHLPDYETKSLKEFANIVASFSSPSMQLEIISMIQNTFKEQGKELECDEVLLHVATIAVKEAGIMEKIKEKQEDDPCIKPSDML